MKCERCQQVVAPGEASSGRCPFCGAAGVADVLPLTGRAAELATLEGFLDARPAPQLIVLRGAQGVGKSRLVEALVAHAGARGGRVDVIGLEAERASGGTGLRALIAHRFPIAAAAADPLQALAPLLAAELPDSADPQVSAEHLAFALGQSDQRFRTRHMDAKARWDSVHVEVARWLASHCAPMPWLLAFEDVHQGDPQSAAFVERLLGLPLERRPIVVLTVRGEELADDSAWRALVSRLEKEPLARVVEIAELPVSELARALEPKLAGRPELAQRVAQQAEGNPLFALEMVALLNEQRAATGKDPAKVPLPSSIREAWAARLEGLTPPALQTLLRAAVVGQRFFEGALAAAGLTREELDAGLPELLRKGLVRAEDGTAGGLEERSWTFRHGLLREVALARIAPAERTRWLTGVDGWAVATLDALGARWEQGAPLLLPLLARVREERAKTHDASLLQEILAGLWRRQQRATEAVVALKKALPPAWGVRKLVLLRQLAEEQHVQGELAQALATASTGTGAVTVRTPQVPPELQRLLWTGKVGPLDRWDTLGYAEAELSLQVSRAEYLAQNGRGDQARSTLELLEQRLDPLTGEVGQKLRLKLTKTFAWFLTEVLANTVATDALLERAARRMEMTTLAPEDRLIFLRAQTLPASRLGQFDRSLALVEEEIQLAQQLGQRRDEAVAWNSKGIMAMACARLEEARECYQRSIEISQQIGFLRRVAIATHNVGLVHLELGDREQAHAAQEKYVEISRVIGNRPAEAYGPATQAAVELALGEDARSVAFIAQATASAEENGWLMLTSWCRALDGQRQLFGAIRSGERQQLRGAANALREGLKTFASESMLWSEEFDPGEHTAFLVSALARLGEAPEAKSRLEEAERRIPPACVISHQWLRAARALLTGEPPGAALEWFEEKKLVRAARMLKRLV